MIAVQALEKRTAELKQNEAQMAVLQSEVIDLKAKHAYFETRAAVGRTGVSNEPIYTDRSREKRWRCDAIS